MSRLGWAALAIGLLVACDQEHLLGVAAGEDGPPITGEVGEQIGDGGPLAPDSGSPKPDGGVVGFDWEEDLGPEGGLLTVHSPAAGSLVAGTSQGPMFRADGGGWESWPSPGCVAFTDLAGNARVTWGVCQGQLFYRSAGVWLTAQTASVTELAGTPGGDIILVARASYRDAWFYAEGVPLGRRVDLSDLEGTVIGAAVADTSHAFVATAAAVYALAADVVKPQPALPPGATLTGPLLAYLDPASGAMLWATAVTADGPAVLELNGGEWTVHRPAQVAWTTLWGVPGAVWAAGEGGRIFHHDGTGWTEETTPSRATLSHLAGAAPTSLWAMGPNDVLLRRVKR